MNAIRAVVRNGHIETDEPLNLPEGMELMIPLPDTSPNGDAASEKQTTTEPEQRPSPPGGRAMGKYAHVPGSSDEFARGKEREIAREDRSRQ